MAKGRSRARSTALTVYLSARKSEMGNVQRNSFVFLNAFFTLKNSEKSK
jgi:hypothetical protein